MQKKKPELLAPAGGMESVAAAMRCGADAVYLGGADFSARQSAANFSNQELREAVEFCHLHGGKVHLAVNTLLLDSQLPLLERTLADAAEAGVDALIIQDLGVLRAARRILPDMPLHASTQLSLHSPRGALQAAELGFSRVVLAREMSREEIAGVCQLPVETEVFVHGALCMSVSGQCLMSAMIGSRSANRGRCAQACRLPFSALEQETERGGDHSRHDLSLKDLSLVRHLPELAGLGVDSFKIEGRMKRPEYVAAAVLACRAALEGREPDLDTLRAVFSRSGFTDGYYTGRRDGSMFGFREKEDVTAAGKVLPGLKARYQKESKAAGLRFEVRLETGKPSLLTAEDGEGNRVTVTGPEAEAAKNQPSGLEQAQKQLSRLGDTVYEFLDVSGVFEGNPFLPASGWNALRREACAAIDRVRLEKARPRINICRHAPPEPEKRPCLRESAAGSPSIRLYFQNAGILPNHRLLEDGGTEQLILPLPVLASLLEKGHAIKEFITKLCAAPPRWIVSEKETLRQMEAVRSLGVSHLFCGNLSHIKMGREMSFTLHGGFGLNALNSSCLLELAELGLVDAELSPELKLSQSARLERPQGFRAGVTAYGRLPLMLLRNCPVKAAAGKCPPPGKAPDISRETSGPGACPGALSDRTGRRFPVACNRDGGASELFNSDPLWMADRLPELSFFDFILLRFTDESPQETASVLAAYRRDETDQRCETDQRSGTPDKGGERPEGATRGLFYRGIL